MFNWLKKLVTKTGPNAPASPGIGDGTDVAARVLRTNFVLLQYERLLAAALGDDDTGVRDIPESIT